MAAAAAVSERKTLGESDTGCHPAAAASRRSCSFTRLPALPSPTSPGGSLGWKHLQQGRRGGLFEKVALTGALEELFPETQPPKGSRGRARGALLAAFAGDAHPALVRLREAIEQAFLAAGGFDGKNAVHAELRRLFDDPLEAVELDEAAQRVIATGGGTAGMGFDARGNTTRSPRASVISAR